MNKRLKMTIHVLIAGFVLFNVIYIANAPKYVKRVEGVVISTDETGINVQPKNGEIIHLDIFKYSVGQEVDVMVYKRGLTGKVSYRSLEMTQLL
jgi:hypothetical protein